MTAIPSTDVLKQLHPASWRGIVFPVMQRDFGFQQSQEQHRFIFRDEQLIESIGQENPTYRYTIPFREDIVRGPYKNLFTQVYPTFIDACVDRTNGILDDPIHGPVQCKVTQLQETLDVGRRDGIDVEVTFITSPDEDFQRQELGTELGTIEGAKGLSGYLDREAEKLDPATKKFIKDLNKGSENGKLDPLSAATAAVNQVETAGNKVQSSFGDVAFKAQRLDDSLRRLQDPNRQPMRTAARQLQLTAIDLGRFAVGKKAARGRIVRSYVTPVAIGKIALAGKLHTTVQDLIRMNPNIARSPIVPAKTQVTYLA